ncbi:VOC family protein [Aliiroseovarius sp. YM-037]|uniref:VOC family protein n=1 Tax=Aliiroseovarius sp. YM-037 TaxID=3341728 RepID=UPI003A813066
MEIERKFKPRALGEIAIRCENIDAMVSFYRDVIGLSPLPGGHRRDIVFLKVADGYAGHTCVLALFRADGDKPATGAASSLHHIALTVSYQEQDAVIAWYESLKQPYRIEEFDWIGWRGIFTQDPDGNTVELVAYDPSSRGDPSAD